MPRSPITNGTIGITATTSHTHDPPTLTANSNTAQHIIIRSHTYSQPRTLMTLFTPMFMARNNAVSPMRFREFTNRISSVR
jgi:hypothetical protein